MSPFNPMLPIVNAQLTEIRRASTDDGYTDHAAAAARWSGDVGVYIEQLLGTEHGNRGKTESEKTTMILEASAVPGINRGEIVRFAVHGAATQARTVRSTKTLEPGLMFVMFDS